MHYDRKEKMVIVEPEDIRGLEADAVFRLLPNSESPTVIVYFKDFLDPTLWSREDLQRTLDAMHAVCHERVILKRLGIGYKPRLSAKEGEVPFYRMVLFSGDGQNIAVMTSLTESDLMRIARHLHCEERDREIHSIAVVNPNRLQTGWVSGRAVEPALLYEIACVGIRHNHIVTFEEPVIASVSKIGAITVEREHRISLRSRGFFQSTRFRPQQQGPEPIRFVPEPDHAELTVAGDFVVPYSDVIANARNRQHNPLGLPPAHEEDAARARRPRDD